jgi:hypothetical protein
MYRLLLVAISMNISNSTASTIASVTYNGTGLTFVGGASSNNQRRVELRCLINSPAGTNSIAIDCLDGFFHDAYQTSLATSRLLAPNGGAAAVWASSGLTEPESQFVMDKNLVQYLFTTPTITIGEATKRSKSGVADVDVSRCGCQMYMEPVR